MVEVRSLKVTACHLNNAGCCYEYTIVSTTRIARRYTIQCSLPSTYTVHIELDGGRQSGREAGKDGGWEGGSKGRSGNTRKGGRERGREKGSERWRDGARGGREEAMMIGRERVSVEEGRVEGGRVAEGNERGRDGPRHGRREGKRGGRKRAEEGLSEEGMEQLREQGREENFKAGILMRALARCIIGNPGETR